MTKKSNIIKKLNNLSPTQIELIDRIFQSFEIGVNSIINPESDLCCKPEFSEYFANLFSIYHSITEHKFEKKSFEFAFKYASIASGQDCVINKNSSNHGEDVTRGTEKISLKTEGEKSKETFKISKFSEARFIAKYKTEIEEKEIDLLSNKQGEKSIRKSALLAKRKDVLLPDLVDELKRKINHHLNSYDRIIGLKSQAIEENGRIVKFKYRLIEIPKDLIKRSLKLKVNDFKPLRGNGGTSASVYDERKRLFGITVDGSVEKISITGIKISKCITHAEFIVPVTI